eukprot:11301042-Ditylum_brightwellii.AAC.2
MCKKVGDNDFDKSTDADIQLIEKVQASGLLSARTKQADEPELRTKSEQKKKHFLAVQQDSDCYDRDEEPISNFLFAHE